MRLREELVEVIGHALERLKPVAIGVGVGHCPVGANRRELVFDKLGNSEIKLGRNPYGVTDKEVLVLKVVEGVTATESYAISDKDSIAISAWGG
jgi:hypothetical protein